jgi:urease accessory protein
MHRVTAIKKAGEWVVTSATDRVILDSNDRRRRRLALASENGTGLLLDLEKPATLRDGDGLVLDDGSVVLVAGRPEHLAEISAPSALEAIRLAWHLGNRHADVQVCGDRLRIRRDHVLEEMAAGLGAAVMPVEAPFDPEPGASHDHQHEHHHGA